MARPIAMMMMQWITLSEWGARPSTSRFRLRTVHGETRIEDINDTLCWNTII